MKTIEFIKVLRGQQRVKEPVVTETGLAEQQKTNKNQPGV